MPHRSSPPPRPARRRRLRPGRHARLLALGAITAICTCALGTGSALAIPMGTLNGSFTIPAGAGAPAHVTVQVVNTDQEITNATVVQQSSTTGTFSLSIAPGTYYVRFEDRNVADNVQVAYYGDGGSDNLQKATSLVVTNGTTTTVPSVALQSGATLSGTVSDANRAQEAVAQIYAFPVYEGVATDPLLADNGLPTYVSLVDGSWKIGGLPPGTYQLEYEMEGNNTNGVASLYLFAYADNGGVTYDTGSASDYPVTAGSSSTINFSVPALAMVSGTVTGPKGPADGIYVYAEDGRLDGYGMPDDETASDGTYSMPLLPGTYQFRFQAQPDLNLAPAWYGGYTQATATPVTLSAGGSATVNETLVNGGTVSGTIVSARGGAAVGGLYVELVDTQGNSIIGALSMPDGSFAIADVPPGNWYVEVTGGESDDGTYYVREFYPGTPSLFGAEPVAVAAGQNVTGITVALLPVGTAPLGMPTETGAALSGLHNNKVALSFNVAAGTGAGYLRTLAVGLPKGFSWNAAKLAGDLSLGSGVTYTDTISNGTLEITLASGQPSVSFTVKAGGITVSKAVEKAAGGLAPKKPKKPKKHKKKKHDLATAAKAKKKKPKPAKPKDTIVSETISLAVSDMTGTGTSLPIKINHPH
jgi:hypothetical protein